MPTIAPQHSLPIRRACRAQVCRIARKIAAAEQRGQDASEWRHDLSALLDALSSTFGPLYATDMRQQAAEEIARHGLREAASG